MPQIKVNEIDQSIYTSVVTDDIVKIFVPVIASFGPLATDETNSVLTFTDVNAFDRVFGYTEPEYNPIKNDYTRIYARELIKKGAAVSCTRLNIGTTSTIGIGEGRVVSTNPTFNQIIKAVYHSNEFQSNIYTGTITGTGNGTTKTFTGTIPTGTSVASTTFDVEAFVNGKKAQSTVTITDQTATATFTNAPASGATVTVRYSTQLATFTDFTPFVFCPQIQSITAKYTGSFGNSLLLAISPVNTTRLSETNQYANISVYYAQKKVVTVDDGEVQVRKNQITGVTRLETKRVSTNPNDPAYFEDVKFDYIQIIPSANARDELATIWGNIEADATKVYSGFPTIPVSYVSAFSNIVYNEDAILSGGTDFGYSDATLAKLQKGFKGYYTGGADGWTQADANTYTEEVYGVADDAQKTGLINQIYDVLTNVYQNYSDPYIYDFDFITSAGLCYEKWSTNSNGDVTTPVCITPGELATVTYQSLTPVHIAMINLVEKRQDCIALFDVPYNYEPTALTEYSRLLNTSYGTMHFPWCYINSPINAGKEILVSPSYVFLYTFLSNLINNVESQKWFPPAGVKRATARIVKRPYFEIGSTLLNDWQNNGTSRVNPIMKLKQFGYVIYGQYTTLEAIDLFTHSALESLNVRLICNIVKKKIFDSCLSLAFEPNNDVLWNKFFDSMDSFLRYMQYNDGIYAYRIVMDKSTVTTDDINQLKCPGKVYIAPTRTAEFFDIDFIITDAGVTFTETV